MIEKTLAKNDKMIEKYPNLPSNVHAEGLPAKQETKKNVSDVLKPNLLRKKMPISSNLPSNTCADISNRPRGSSYKTRMLVTFLNQVIKEKMLPLQIYLQMLVLKGPRSSFYK